MAWQAAAQIKYATWEKEKWQKVKQWDGKWQKLSDPFLKRQFKFMSILGTAALPKTDLEKVSRLKSCLLLPTALSLKYMGNIDRKVGFFVVLRFARTGKKIVDCVYVLGNV